VQNDKQGGVHHDLGVEKEAATPHGKSFSRALQLME
jgi:hypothetical protein